MINLIKTKAVSRYLYRKGLFGAVGIRKVNNKVSVCRMHLNSDVMWLWLRGSHEASAESEALSASPEWELS